MSDTPAIESEKLINELERIMLSGDWRKNQKQAARVDEIKERLGILLQHKHRQS